MLKRFISVVLCIGICVFSGIIALAASYDGQTVQASPDYSGYIEIKDAAGLKSIANNPSGKYVLTDDIDLKNTPWDPIEFSGVLDGNGYTIYNLFINKTNPNTYITIDGNYKKYDTYFAGLFSKTENANIENIHLLNVNINITFNDNIFIAGLVGDAVNSTIENCSVDNERLYVYTKKSTKDIFGAGGIVGFGTGYITNSESNNTIIIVDGNPSNPAGLRCEAFLGGILACGHSYIDGCSVTTTGYASLHGYMHTGCIVGMQHRSDPSDPGGYYIKNCTTVSGTQYYYEDQPDPRPYCYGTYGEIFKKQHPIVYNNKIISFSKYNYKAADKILTPWDCSNPQYITKVTPPTDTQYGYTTYTCTANGYTYTDNYVHPTNGVASPTPELTASPTPMPTVSPAPETTEQRTTEPYVQTPATQPSTAAAGWQIIVIIISGVLVIMLILLIILLVRKRKRQK